MQKDLLREGKPSNQGCEQFGSYYGDNKLVAQQRYIEHNTKAKMPLQNTKSMPAMQLLRRIWVQKDLLCEGKPSNQDCEQFERYYDHHKVVTQQRYY